MRLTLHALLTWLAALTGGFALAEPAQGPAAQRVAMLARAHEASLLEWS